MSFIDDFLDLMPDSVQVERLISRASDGTPTFTIPVSYRARVVHKIHNVLGRDNQLVIARGIAWLATTEVVNSDDRLTLSDGTKPLIVLSATIPDEDGPAYTRVDFQ